MLKDRSSRSPTTGSRQLVASPGTMRTVRRAILAAASYSTDRLAGPAN
jgi:hypothetical protein